MHEWMVDGGERVEGWGELPTNRTPQKAPEEKPIEKETGQCLLYPGRQGKVQSDIQSFQEERQSQSRSIWLKLCHGLASGSPSRWIIGL